MTLQVDKPKSNNIKWKQVYKSDAWGITISTVDHSYRAGMPLIDNQVVNKLYLISDGYETKYVRSDDFQTLRDFLAMLYYGRFFYPWHWQELI